MALLTPAAIGQPVPVPPADLDRLALDALKDVHNRGAELYNTHRPAECLAMYDGAVRAVRPFLAHRPAIQRQIDDGLADAGRAGEVRLQAFRLHEVIEEVRVAIKLELRKLDTGKLSVPTPQPAGPPSVMQLIDAARSGPVGGVVRAAGRLVAGAEVMAVSLTLPEPRTAHTATRADGTFRFPAPLPAGEYALKVVPPAGVAVAAKYQEFATSGLRLTVGAGPTDVSLDLAGR
ncbi:MAG: carboxypeptidase-like regulatory domain-containing protein [Gemmataceae bacterium]